MDTCGHIINASINSPYYIIAFLLCLLFFNGSCGLSINIIVLILRIMIFSNR